MPSPPSASSGQALRQAQGRPFGSPARVLKYLSRYTHRIAISNRRIKAMDEQTVSFGYKDYAHGGRARVMTLAGTEFLRRFLLHVVPRGFMRIRHFGFLANRVRTANLELCRQLLGPMPGPAAAVPDAPGVGPAIGPDEPADHRDRCPVCGLGRMTRCQDLPPQPSRLPLLPFHDTS
jgi:hypothetical protein